RVVSVEAWRGRVQRGGAARDGEEQPRGGPAEAVNSGNHGTSESGLRREHQREAFVAFRELDPERRRQRAVQAEADAVVAFQLSLREFAAAGRRAAAGV